MNPGRPVNVTRFGQPPTKKRKPEMLTSHRKHFKGWGYQDCCHHHNVDYLLASIRDLDKTEILKKLLTPGKAAHGFNPAGAAAAPHVSSGSGRGDVGHSYSRDGLHNSEIFSYPNVLENTDTEEYETDFDDDNRFSGITHQFRPNQEVPYRGTNMPPPNSAASNQQEGFVYPASFNPKSVGADTPFKRRPHWLLDEIVSAIHASMEKWQYLCGNFSRRQGPKGPMWLVII